MVRGIISINNITLANENQWITVEEEIGLWAFESLKLHMRKTTESEQKGNSYFIVKMRIWPQFSYVFLWHVNASK